MTEDFDIEEYLRESYPDMHGQTRKALVSLWHEPVTHWYNKTYGARLFRGRIHVFRGHKGVRLSQIGGHFCNVYYFDDGVVSNRWSAIDKWVEINLEKLKKSDFASQLFLQFFSK